MSNLRKIIAWILIFAITISMLVVSASAASGVTDPDPTDSRGSFYDWLVSRGGSFGGGRDFGGGGRPVYDEFVSELPATGYGSDGCLYWSPAHVFISINRTGSGTSVYCDHYSTGSLLDLKIIENGNSFLVLPYADYKHFSIKYFSGRFSGEAPVDGVYQRIESLCADYKISLNYDLVADPSSDSKNWSAANAVYYSAGDSVVDTFKYDMSVYCSSTVLNYVTRFSGSCAAPIYKVTPVASISGDTYNINTRPTTITGGNYGIVGDNGTINTVTTNNQIISETNNTYYNPATGQTSTVMDWSYNYEDRSYTITLEGGDTAIVTYGDENITITENNVVEGDTTVNHYTIYYMIDGGGSSPDPAPTACAHSWQETGRTEPTCTAPGKVVSSCSSCGETRTEAIPALGHDWALVRTVPTEYDENGVQTQEGYTLYECRRCGEQYKDADSTGPPDGGVDDGGLIEWLNDLIRSLSDNLSGVVELLRRFFTEIPGLFGGSELFPSYPFASL